MAEFGRGWDWGYGPRYELPFTVPMAIGTGVACARVWSALRLRPIERTTLEAVGAFAVIVVAVFVGVVRIAPLLYPFAYSDVHARNRLARALDLTPLHNALVVAEPNVSTTSPLDLTENLPIDLYPDADVLLANNHDPGTVQCLREHFRTRKFYRAFAGDPSQIVPFK
jgi:hypothetical protein